MQRSKKKAPRDDHQAAYRNSCNLDLHQCVLAGLRNGFAMHKISLLFSTLFCLAGAAAAVELPMATITPVVLSEIRTLVFSAYNHNPDCSVNEVPVARIIKRPAKGEVEIEEGSGYSHYPKNSQLYECNTKQTLMSNIFYTSTKGFKGSDNFEIEVFSAGNSRKIRFRLAVR